VTAVQLTISDPALIGLLRLPQDTETAGASFSDGVLTLTLEMPDAAPGAVSMEPQYTRASGWPDPVSLTGIRWLDADGQEIWLTEPGP
jgi:hypothetical protein